MAVHLPQEPLHCNTPSLGALVQQYTFARSPSMAVHLPQRALVLQ